MKSSVTIRMGAAHWDATVQANGRPVHFDFRKMDRTQRGRWYGTFMAAVRKTLRKKAA